MARSVGTHLQAMLSMLTIVPLGMAMGDWLMGALARSLLFGELSTSPCLFFLGTVLPSFVPCRGLRPGEIGM